jgi:hypothetical protein
VALNNTYEARLVQQETALGAGLQVLLLALIGSAIGLGPAGWLTGLAFAIATWAVLSRALHRSGSKSFGPANRVTLGRATLVGGVTAIQGASFDTQRSNESLVRNVDGMIFGAHHARATIDLPESLDAQRGGKTFQNILTAIGTGEVTAH